MSDPALDTANASRFGVAPKELRVEPGIKLERVDEAAQHFRLCFWPARELAGRRRRRIETIGIERRCLAKTEPAEPEMVKRRLADRSAGIAERVDIAAVRAFPADELDAKLVRRSRRPHELVFVDTERGIDELQLRDRGFADADGSDLVGFYERDRVALRRQEAGANRRREPPSSASADHKNSKKSLAHRGSLIRTIQKEMAARQIERAAIPKKPIRTGTSRRRDRSRHTDREC